jgi:hypothetical protein
MTLQEKIDHIVTPFDYSSDEAAREHMVTITVPVWAFVDNDPTNDKIATERRVTVHKLIADDLISIMTQIFNDPEQFPFYLDGTSYQLAGYNHRFISGTTRLSHHSYGTAIDINWKHNPQFAIPEDNPFKICPEGSVVRIFTEHGWYWGGDYSTNRLDYMHFSLTERGANSRILH